MWERIKASASRAAGWLGRRRVDEEFREELGEHLEMLAEENMRRGMSREEARRAARMRLGGETQLRETNRELRGLPPIETFWQDLKFSLRGLRRSPGFALVCVLTLALGIGANTAIFSVINAVLLQQLPFPNAERVLMLHRHEGSSVPYAEYLDLEAQQRSFELLALFRQDTMILTGAGEPQRVLVRMCSPDFLTIVGVKPIRGRLFTKEEDHLGAAPAVVLSESLWRERFNADPGALGSSAALDGKDYTVIGVVPDLPRQFSRSDVFYPIGQWDEPSFRIRGYGFGALGLAKMKPGVTLKEVRADLDHISKNLAAAYPKEDVELGFTAMSFRDYSVGDMQSTLLLLFGAVGFVLLIACANVANLLLARSTSRKRELAIRVTMGAGRWRVMRQLLTETLVLALLGGGLGLLLAVWGTQAMIAAAPAGLLNAEVTEINLRVLFFTLAISVGTGVLFGILPAWKAARVNVQETLKEGGRGTTGVHQRAQGVLVISEIALALILLTGSGLLIRSLTRVWQVNPGFDPRNVFAFRVRPSPETAKDGAKTRALYSRLIEGLEGMPGADSVSMVFGNLPLTGDSDIAFWREDRPKPLNITEAPDAMYYGVAPNYLRAMRIPLLAGRFIQKEDVPSAPAVVVINDKMVPKLFPNEEPLGKHLYLTFLDQSVEIVGIAGTVKHYGLDARPEADTQFQIYLSAQQMPDHLLPFLAKGSWVVVRTAGSPQTIVAAARQAVREVDSRQVMYGETTMQELLDDSLGPRRFALTMLGVFSGLALVLASIGIYGVISNLVGQSAHEFGVRMALGAQQKDVLRLVLSRGLWLDLLGVGIGIAAALPLMRLLGTQLFQVTATDPLTFVAVAALLTGVALLACFIPAYRATRVDPLVTLRHE